MAARDLSYFRSTPLNQEYHQNELLFHLYMFTHAQGQYNENQRVITDPNRPNAFGCTGANDWTIRDGPTLGANIVARAQGLHLGASMTDKNWFTCFNIVFNDKRFKTSSLKVLGSFMDQIDGEWAIVGGTGEFAFAQGAVTHKVIENTSGNTTRELHIRALCLVVQKPTSLTRIGPWGGNGGTTFDVIDPIPQRLESVVIRSGIVVNSIAFSYIDSAGKKQNLGPWGGDGELTDTIVLAPFEIMKEVLGTTGNFGEETVVTSLTFVTNVRTYGPFGKTSGDAFSVPLKDTDLVAFFVRAGGHVNAFGVYGRPSITS